MKVIMFYEKNLVKKSKLFFKDDVSDLSQSYKLFDFNNFWNCQFWNYEGKSYFVIRIYMILKLILSVVTL